MHTEPARIKIDYGVILVRVHYVEVSFFFAYKAFDFLYNLVLIHDWLNTQVAATDRLVYNGTHTK